MDQYRGGPLGPAGIAIVLAGTVLAANARAEVVEFTNDGQQFAWLIHELFDSQVLVQSLDPTAGPSQGGEPLDRGVSYGRYLTESNGQLMDQTDVLVGGSALGLGLDRVVFAPVPYNLLLRLPRLYLAGELIGPDTLFIPNPERLSLMFESPFVEPEAVAKLDLGEFVVNDDLLLFARAHGVVGIEIGLADGVHYGWIEVLATFDPDGRFEHYVPLRWAYETSQGTPIEAPISFCPADIDGSGTVDIVDFLNLLASWGPCPPGGPCAADIDGDGHVGVTDLLALLLAWDSCT